MALTSENTLPTSLSQLSSLLAYPGEGFTEVCRAVVAQLEIGHPAAAESVRQFSDAIAGIGLDQLQEIYTRTFDLAPLASPYLTTYMYGDESFQRGEFMTKLSQRYLETGYDYGNELPDHACVVLGYCGYAQPDELAELRAFCLKPCFEKFRQALSANESPYALIAASVLAVVES